MRELRHLGAALLLALASGAVHAQVMVVDSVAPGPLWSGLQELARLTGQRVLVPDGSQSLDGIVHSGVSADVELDVALETMLADTPFTWRRDRFGSVLIVPRQRSRAELDALRIESTAVGSHLSLGRSGHGGERDRQIAGASRIEGVQLQSIRPQRFADILRRAPNISGYGDGLAIRGIERGAPALAASQVYLDGIPLESRLLWSLPVPPLARVDYLRGPRTIGDGVGSMAGLIHLETPTPEPEPSANVAIGAQADASYEYSAAVGGQIGSHGPSASLGATSRMDAGSIDNVVTGEQRVDRSNQTFARGKLVYEPDTIEALTMQLSWLALRADPGDEALVPPTGAVDFDPFDRVSHDPLPRQRRLTTDGLALAGTWRLTDRAQLRATWQGAQGSVLTRAASRTNPGLSTRREESEDVSETGLRWEQELSARWRMALGVDRTSRDNAVRDATDERLQSFFDAPIVVEPVDAFRRRETSVEGDAASRSVFGEIEWTGARLDLGAGLRRVLEQRESTRIVDNRLSVDGCVIRFVDGARPCEQEFDESLTRQTTPYDEALWLPNLRMGWRVSPTQSYGAELRRGFIGGGARLDPATSQLIAFGPERSEALDLRWSNTWLDGRLRADVNLFHHRWKDRHVTVDLPVQDGFIVLNAGEARAVGGEFEVQYDHGDTLSTWAGVGWLHTRYGRFDAPVAGGTEDLSGREFPGAPSVTATLGVQWTFLPEWRLAASNWYAASTYSDALNSPSGERPGYSLLDLALSRSFGPDIELECYARNALDEEYLEDVRVAGIRPRPRDYILGRERSVGVTLRWQW